MRERIEQLDARRKALIAQAGPGQWELRADVLGLTMEIARLMREIEIKPVQDVGPGEARIVAFKNRHGQSARYTFDPENFYLGR